MRKHSLQLLDEEIRIVSEKGEVYVENLGKYILSTIEKFDNVATPFPMPYLTKALYACVFLADELFDKREEIEKLEAKIAELEGTKRDGAQESKGGRSNDGKNKNKGK